MTGTWRSALYAGSVMHRRLQPRRHRLDYRMFLLLLDLDEIDAVTRRLRLFSRGRFNLFSFHDRDHGAGTVEPLRAQVDRHLREAGITDATGPVRLLAMPRILGYAFNPLSIYFCHRDDGGLAAILYEVNNTFGQRHSYLLAADLDENGIVRQRVGKAFYVSPFMEMAMTYDFCVLPPGERLMVSIAGRKDGEPVLSAVLTAERTELTDAALLRAFFVYPVLTLKVIAGIHWEALRIWLKGIRLVDRPPPPEFPVTTAPVRAVQPTGGKP